MSGNIPQTLTDLEILWSALDAFYQRFSPQDWARKHGKDWTFADMPYHLAYFNQMVLDGIKNDHREKVLLNLDELNIWNNAHYSERPSSLVGAKNLDYLHETQAKLKQAATQLVPETPVFMPLIIVGGWRTLSFALEYLFNHTWSHFTESHLRYTGSPPDLPADLVYRALDFAMEMTGGMLRADDLDGVNLVTTLRLTGPGGGTWTFTMRDGKCLVEANASAQADTEITTDITTYLKTTIYNMQSPILALLMGRTKIKGMAGSRQFQKLYAITPARIWNIVDRGKTVA